MFWAKEEPYERGYFKTPDWVYNFGSWLASDKNGNDSWLTKFCDFLNSKRKRKMKIKLDDYDVKNTCETLTCIILPMLKKIKEERKSIPFIDEMDVPEELRSKSVLPDNFWVVDENFEKRWEWLIDEMIWAFEQLHPDTPNWEDSYDLENNMYDYEALKAHEERIVRGTTLFGKYFMHLFV